MIYLQCILHNALLIIWIMDILNFPCAESLDTEYPFNTLAWILYWLLRGTVTYKSKSNDNNNDDTNNCS